MFSHSLRPFGRKVHSCLLSVRYPVANHCSIGHTLKPFARLSTFVRCYFAAFRCAVGGVGALDVAVRSYKSPFTILWHLTSPLNIYSDLLVRARRSYYTPVHLQRARGILLDWGVRHDKAICSSSVSFSLAAAYIPISEFGVPVLYNVKR
jgi:hypothetical protein